MTGFFVWAALLAPSGPLSLHTAMDVARTAPGPVAAQAQARAAEAAAKAALRSAYLPGVGVEASHLQRTDPFKVTTPIGTLPLQPETQTQFAVQAIQPLFDPGKQLYAAPAARADAKAARLSARRVEHERMTAAGLAWLALASVDKRLVVAHAGLKRLEAQKATVDALVDGQRALPIDALKVQLALDQAQQRLTAIERSRAVSVAQLEQHIGSGFSGQLAALPPLPGRATGDAAPDPTTRADVAALTAQLPAFEHRRDAIWGELLPTVTAEARWLAAETNADDGRQWFEGAVVLRWTGFAAGTRSARDDALEAQLVAHRARLRDARSGVVVQTQAARAALNTALDAFEVQSRAVEIAAETLRLETERHRAQRATTNDLLDAEGALSAAEGALALAEITAHARSLELRLATGAPSVHAGEQSFSRR